MSSGCCPRRCANAGWCRPIAGCRLPPSTPGCSPIPTGKSSARGGSAGRADGAVGRHRQHPDPRPGAHLPATPDAGAWRPGPRSLRGGQCLNGWQRRGHPPRVPGGEGDRQSGESWLRASQQPGAPVGRWRSDPFAQPRYRDPAGSARHPPAGAGDLAGRGRGRTPGAASRRPPRPGLPPLVPVAGGRARQADRSQPAVSAGALGGALQPYIHRSEPAGRDRLRPRGGAALRWDGLSGGRLLRRRLLHVRRRPGRLFPAQGEGGPGVLRAGRGGHPPEGRNHPATSTADAARVPSVDVAVLPEALRAWLGARPGARGLGRDPFAPRLCARMERAQGASNRQPLKGQHRACPARLGIGARRRGRATMRAHMSRVLVISNDFVNQRMAGPAIRSFELSRQLHRAGHEVTLASRAETDLPPQPFPIIAHDTRTLEALGPQHDVILFQGHILDAYPFLAESGACLVADLYGPFTLELLVLRPLQPTVNDLPDWDQTLSLVDDQLRLRDYFLCASEKQFDYCVGALSALNRINPQTFARDPSMRSLIDLVPFGLPEEPPVKRAPAMRGVIPGIGDHDLILLAGTIYNWLDPLTLIRGVATASRRHPELRLVFMGTAHPNRYAPKFWMIATARRLAEELGLLNRVVFVH